MAIVLLNGDVAGVPYSANTWGELLGVLDDQCAASGEVITGVSLGGVEVPAFRVTEVLSSPLVAHTEVLVETARPADLIRQTLDEADAAAAAIVEAGTALAASYRAAQVSEANTALSEFAESLSTLIVVTSAVAQSAGVDLARRDGEMPAADTIDRLISHTEMLLMLQQAGDWMQMADLIDNQLLAAVRQLPLVLTAIREAVPALEDVA